MLPYDDVQPGEPITAEAWNALTATARRAARLSVSPPLAMVRGPQGVHLSLSSPVRLELAQLDEALERGGTATATLWHGRPPTSTSRSVEVHDWLLALATDQIEADTKVIVGWVNGAWYVVAAACYPSS